MKRGAYHDAVAAFKRAYLTAQLMEHGGCHTTTAREIGLPRTYLVRLLRDAGIVVPRTAKNRFGR